ncbi:GLPGLI family protein [Polaribacter sp. WD7]|uniref:GLPGLI family protein n=1 Tax=Polaribacter sp. WD7 TaxID=2269061 RepID=UPI000DF46E5F|nr:GLPGLI family protein [Polaribacter sp. WD7]RCS27863.1 GLPGLI family protein [Polaribacter sp. WD7]
MLKIQIQLFFFFFSTAMFTQNFCGKAIYKIKGYIELNYEMNFDKNKSFNLQIIREETNFKNKEEVVIKNSGNVQKNTILGSKNIKPAFFLNNKNDFYYNSEYIDGSIDIIKENMSKWSWKILQEKKKIGGFVCQKARTKFRGSNFTAWFTTEIPVPFGPWKSKDLPGLILELYDDNGLTHMNATKITIENNKKCNFDYAEKIDLTKAISIPDFLKREKQKDIAYFKQLNAKLPKGAKRFIIGSECEDCPKDIKLENFEVEN